MLPYQLLPRCTGLLFCLSLVLASCNDGVEASYSPKQAKQQEEEPLQHRSVLQEDLAREHNASSRDQAVVRNLKNDLAYGRNALSEHQARARSLQSDLARERGVSLEHQAGACSLESDLVRERRVSLEHRARARNLQSDLVRERRISLERRATVRSLERDLGVDGMVIPETWQVSIESRDMLLTEDAGECPVCLCYGSFFKYGMCRCPHCNKFFCQKCYRDCRETAVEPFPKCPCCRTAPLDGIDR